MKTDLKDKCVLITGASGGIGQSVASAFAAEGSTLALHYHRNARSVEKLLGELKVHGVAVHGDLSDERQADAMFAGALKAFPRIDVVVVNAGAWCTDDVPLCDMTLAQWRQTMDADLTSAFLTCRAFLRHLKAVPRESAAIVLVGSTAAIFGEAGHADYSAAKAALTYGLTKTLKNEIVRLAPRGRVNCVCPGWTVTPMSAGQLADTKMVKRITATRPLQAIARPEDIAAAIVFLSSDTLAGHISGAVLPIAGGMEGRLLNP
jgi:3-oxoacyl-[acyl-carrier protein] reductase